MARPLAVFLKKRQRGAGLYEDANAFQEIKEGLLHAPILSLPNTEYPFSVSFDASEFAIGTTLL